MFIKNVTIHGFKSYHEKSSVGPFHEGFNVVLGRNGAGKSNFFAAIEFVLSDEFSSLRPEQRTSLLYAGSSGTSTGVRVINGYVELLVDNQSGRFPVQAAEFNLRRSINTKMDQFHLNGTLITRKELRAKMETAGFSSSNPYHIVKQGKIAFFATCSDKARLDIIKDLAGAKVYDTKREESIKMFQTCDAALGETGQMAEHLAARFEELLQEKEDLEKLQKLQASKTIFEYLIFTKDIEDINSKVKNLKFNQAEFAEEMKATKPKLQKTAVEVEELKSHVENKAGRYRAVCEDLEENRRMLDDKLKKKAGLELAVKDLQDEDLAGRDREEEEEKERLAEELTSLAEKKTSLEKELGQNLAQFEKFKERLECLEHEQKEILEKTGRSNQFGSKEERDGWIREKIKENQSSLEQKRLEVAEAGNQLKSSKARLTNLEAELEQRKAETEELQSQLHSVKEELRAKEVARSGEAAECQEARQEIHGLQVGKERAQEESSAAEAKMKSLPGMKQIFIGIQSLQQLLESSPHLRQGYHGILLELVEWSSEELNVAIEQAVGIKVFHHVVSSDKVATKILKELNRRKLPGVFNFFPMNRIRPRDWSAVSQQENTFRLLEKLDFEDNYSELMKFVFGSILICRNLEVAVSVSRHTKMDCVTLEGDKAIGKGVLTGGYFSKDKNKITGYLSYSETVDTLDEITGKQTKLQEKLHNKESDLMKKNKEVDEFKMKIQVSKKNIGREEDAMKVAQRERDLLFAQNIDLDKQISSSETSIKLLESSISNLEKEIQDDFKTSMSRNVKERFKVLVKNIEQAKTKFKKQNEKVGTIESKLSEAGGKMEELRKNIQEVSEAISSTANKEERLESLERELAVTTKVVEGINKTVSHLTAKEEESQRRIASDKKLLEEKKSELLKLKKKDSENTVKLEKILEKKVQYQNLLKKYNNQIRDLGGLNTTELSRYQKEQKSTLKSKLSDVLATMKDFDNVNMKAIVQVEAFSEKDDIEQKLKELNQTKKALSTLISSLDNKRIEQMAYTFKQMMKNFQTTFEKIVPMGRGQLEVVGGPDEGSEVEKFTEATGIQVKVTFTGKVYSA